MLLLVETEGALGQRRRRLPLGGAALGLGGEFLGGGRDGCGEARGQVLLVGGGVDGGGTADGGWWLVLLLLLMGHGGGRGVASVDYGEGGADV